MVPIITGFDPYFGHWWYCIPGTTYRDRGYRTEEEAEDCAKARWQFENRRSA